MGGFTYLPGTAPAPWTNSLRGFFYLPGAGGGGGGAVTIRGADAVAYPAATSFTVAFPAGCVAGDTAMIQVCAAWDITAPSGWTQLYLLNATTWNGYVGWKTLTAGDISTGSVTVSAPGGSFNGSSNIVVFAGAVTVREFQSSQVGGFLGTWTTSSAVLATDLGIVFGSNRGLTTMPTVTGGTALDTALNGSFPSALYSVALVNGVNTVVSNMSGAPQWEGALIVVHT